MLGKELCKRCRNASKLTWTDETDFVWDVGGRVDCPVSNNDRSDFMRFVDSMPPQCCPYLLEQFVLNQDATPPPDEWLLDLVEKEGEP